MTAEAKILVSAKDDASPVLKKLQKDLASIKGSLDSFGQVGMSFGTVGIVGMLKAASMASLDAYLQVEKLNKAYASITGSGSGAADMLTNIRKETERLGLSYIDSAEQAKGFFASIRGTTLQGAAGMNIFSGMAEVGTSLGLGVQDMDRAYRALGQISSKGKVMAEELRGQLGEVVPGAFQMAARAMGMTTAELDKFMSDGKLMADEFLPKFGDQLRKEFGESAQKASQDVQASINRMSSAWTEAKANFMDSENAVSGIRAVTEALKNYNVAQNAYREERNLEKEMEKAGWAKQSYATVSYGFVGERIESMSSGYSEQQKEIFREQQKLVLEEKKKAEEAAATLEKTLGDNRKSIDDAYKKTAAGQRATMAKEHQETLAAFDSQIAEYKKQGTDYGTLFTQRAAVVADYKKKLEALNKKESGGTSDRAVESAHIALQGLNAELAKLEGRKADSFAENLQKKLMEIARKGKDAKLSLEEIGALQGRYSRAAQEDLQRQQSTALRKLEAETAGAMGDETKSRALQREESLRKWKEELLGIGLALDQVQPLLDNWNRAQEQKNTIKNAQEAANFYRELSQLSGQYVGSLEHQNELLRLQAENLIVNVGITRETAAEWERLKQLELARDPFSGLERGMRKYTADATNYASQFESAWSGAMGSFEDALTRAMTTGKMSFADFVSFIGTEMARMASKQITGGLTSGLGSLLGSIFGGGDLFGGAYSSGVVQNVPRGPVGASHGGGIVGFGQYSAVRQDNYALYSNAPKYHDGYGLKADERRAILQTGETVLSRSDTRYFKAMLKNADASQKAPAMPDFSTAALMAMRAPGQSSAPAVVNNISVTPPAGYAAEEERKPNNGGGEDIRITFSRMMASEAGTYGSPLNKSLRSQGLRTPVTRQG